MVHVAKQAHLKNRVPPTIYPRDGGDLRSKIPHEAGAADYQAVVFAGPSGLVGAEVAQEGWTERPPARGAHRLR